MHGAADAPNKDKTLLLCGIKREKRHAYSRRQIAHRGKESRIIVTEE